MSDIDGTSSAHLRGKYAIVGVGETEYTRGSGVTTRALGTTAVRRAVEDAGLEMSDVDAMMSYSGNDSTMSPVIAGELGIRLNFHMDVIGGGSSIEALIGIAMGWIEAGRCKTMVIFRAMNGFSQVRIGGTGRGSSALNGASLLNRGIGLSSAGQMFAQ